tara:strand:- start:863 stop:1060 length:198 start_codon:yes stop_codon:yes gene_type:complete
MTKRQITTGITFGVFMTEAIVHYNLGANRYREDKKFSLPPSNDLARLAVTVAIFSVINGWIIDQI